MGVLSLLGMAGFDRGQGSDTDCAQSRAGGVKKSPCDSQRPSLTTTFCTSRVARGGSVEKVKTRAHPVSHAGAFLYAAVIASDVIGPSMVRAISTNALAAAQPHRVM